MLVRLQSGQNSCGLAAVANALRALGRAVTEDQIASRVKRAADAHEPHVVTGTIEQQIAKALRAMKIPTTQMQLHSPVVALSALRGFLVVGCPALLAVDNDEHWVVATSFSGDRFHVVDSAHEEIVVAYNERDLAGRWGMVGDPLRFYGLVLTGRRGR